MTAAPRLRDALAHPGLLAALGLGVLLRVPGAALFPSLTLLAVLHLHTGYAVAGVLTAAYALSCGLVAPLRGRMIDRRGVRRALAPLLPVGALAWTLAPHLSYPGVLVTAVLAGLSSTPVWGVARQIVLRAAPPEHRHAALSLDSVGTEVAFIVGPLAGIAMATGWDPRWTVTVVGAAAIAGPGLLCLLDPTVGSADDGTVGQRVVGPELAGLLMLVLIATVVLAATDTLLLALLRGQHAVGVYAIAAAMSAAGSMVGAVCYGALRRPIGAAPLTALLAGITLVLALPLTVPVIVMGAFVCGTACAPALTAITEAITAEVPAPRRTEAFGWYSTANTAGGAIASPAIGAMIDIANPRIAAAVLALGALVAVAVVTAIRPARAQGC